MRSFWKTAMATSVIALSLAACSSPSGSAVSGNASSPASAPHATAAKGTQTGSSATIAGDGTHRVVIGLGIEMNDTVQGQPAPGTCAVRKASNGQPLPDPNCTPGTTNPGVTQGNIDSTICRSGYTSSIRPTAAITEKEKKQNASSYGYRGNLADAEYDHLISLELGGSPNDPKNLWVEPPGPDWQPSDKFRNDKDAVENKLNSLVCAHKVTLADAQNAIANDWTTALAKLGQ